jgi:hypothetical protein
MKTHVPAMIEPVIPCAPCARAIEAVVMLGDSIVEVVHLEPGKGRSSLSLGTGHDADIQSAHAPAALLPLVTRRGHDMVVCIPGGVRAELHDHGHSQTMDELAALGLARPAISRAISRADAAAGGIELTMPDRGSVVVHLGPARVFIRSVAVERTRAARLPVRLDGSMARFAAASVLAHLAVLAFLHAIPPAPQSLSLDLGSQEARMARIRSKAAETPVSEPLAGSEGDPASHTSALDIRTPAADPVRHRPGSFRSASRTAGQPGRDQAVGEAMNQGISGLLAREGGAFGDVAQAAGGPFSDGDLLAFRLATDREGAPFGTTISDVGPRPGTIPAGSYRTGPWPGTSGPPGAELAMRRGERGEPRVQPRPPSVDGDIDKATIGRRIKERLARIQHCYERELMQSPDLSGTITSEFLIDGRGAVLYARATGMGNTRLESCVAQVIETIRFPRPGDHGSVKVSYPFHFRKAG